MTTSLRTRLGVAFNGLFLGCVIFFALALAYNHVQLITHEYPLDYNEGGMLVTTQSLVNGENPYSVESQPAHISLYPILTNILVAPLARAFGNTFELHRVFSAVFIIACCAICYYLCRKESGRRTESFVAAALCYAAFLHYSTPVASTNSFGLFLFLAAIAIPWVQGFSTRSLAVSIVLGVLAFYTKQYFVACLGYVALYVFLAESKKRAIYYGLATTCIFIVGLAVVAYTSPYYFEATFFAVGAAYAEYSGNQFVNRQLIEYMQIYLPLLVILASMIVYSRYSQRLRIARAGKNIKSPLFVNLFDLDEPLLRLKPNYIWFCGACSLITFVLILGRNPGNHLTYLFQLISPFFIV